MSAPPKRLPASAKIGYRVYKLMWWAAPDATAANARAIHTHVPAQIKISEGQEPQDAAESMIHELLHACWRGLPEGDEERIVSALAENLAQVWIDNPDLITWLSAGFAAGRKGRVR